jgi:hypothetical protein
MVNNDDDRLATLPPYSCIHTPQQNSDLDICFATIGYESHFSRREFIDSFCMFGVFDLFTLRDHMEDVMYPPAQVQKVHQVHSGAPAAVDNKDDTKEQHHSSFSSVPPLCVIVSLLKLSCWDPDILGQFGEYLSAILETMQVDDLDLEVDHHKEATKIALVELKLNMPRLLNNLNPRFDVDGSLQKVCSLIKSQLETI